MPDSETSSPLHDTLPATRQGVLLNLHEALLASLAQARHNLGIGAIHAVRVNARRLRVALKAMRKECQPTSYNELNFDLRDIGRAFAAARETDVRRQHLAPLLRRVQMEATDPALQRDAQQFLAHLDQTRSQTRHTLRAAWHDPRWTACLQRIATNITSHNLIALPRVRDDFAVERARLQRQLRRVHKLVTRKGSLKQHLHPLRLRVKEARYLQEILQQLGPIDSHQSSALKELQNRLGDVHDAMQVDLWLQTTPCPTALQTLLAEKLSLTKRRYRARLTALHDKLLRDGRL